MKFFRVVFVSCHTILCVTMFSCCIFCAFFSCCTFFRVACFSCCNIFLVTLFSCCTFFHVGIFSRCTFFRVGLFSCCTFLLLHTFFCSTSFILQFFSVCTFTSDLFMVLFFAAAFPLTVHFSHFTPPCHARFMLHLFSLTLFSCCTLFIMQSPMTIFHAAFISCCGLLRLHFFILRFSHVALFEVALSSYNNF